MSFKSKDTTRLYIYPNCECLFYPGRTHCYNCVQDNYEVDEGRNREEKEPKKPNWFFKWARTRLNQQDLNFLSGFVPNPGWKPYKGRRK